MGRNERFLITGLFVAMFLLVAVDLVQDLNDGVAGWHLSVEVVLGVLSATGLWLLRSGHLTLHGKLSRSNAEIERLREESDVWKQRSKSLLEGLSESIDHQLSRWKLTAAEKEVAFLLLKGLSIKDIAGARDTTEKTARAQSASIYSKSGLAGRSELSAFFLEDLFLPNEVLPKEAPLT